MIESVGNILVGFLQAGENYKPYFRLSIDPIGLDVSNDRRENVHYFKFIFFSISGSLFFFVITNFSIVFSPCHFLLCICILFHSSSLSYFSLHQVISALLISFLRLSQEFSTPSIETRTPPLLRWLLLHQFLCISSSLLLLFSPQAHKVPFLQPSRHLLQQHLNLYPPRLHLRWHGGKSPGM